MTFISLWAENKAESGFSESENKANLFPEQPGNNFEKVEKLKFVKPQVPINPVKKG